MEPLEFVVFCLVMVIMAGTYLWSVSWAIGDAHRRGQGGGLLFLLFFVLGPIAALIWLVVRPKEVLVTRSPETYDDPEEALSAASRLDRLGDWDAAYKLYASIAKRWPENEEYVGNCLRELDAKLATLKGQANTTS